jgi:hypothetical protein
MARDSRRVAGVLGRARSSMLSAHFNAFDDLPPKMSSAGVRCAGVPVNTPAYWRVRICVEITFDALLISWRFEQPPAARRKQSRHDGTESGLKPTAQPRVRPRFGTTRGSALRAAAALRKRVARAFTFTSLVGLLGDATREHPELDFCSDWMAEVSACVVVCGRCLVRAECFEAGRTEHAGVWGACYRGDRLWVRDRYGPKVIRSTGRPEAA